MTPQIYNWALRHGVSFAALDELKDIFGMHGGHSMPAGTTGTGTSENAVGALVRLEASRKGVRIWRNNVGVLRDETGRPVRYGLANESKQLNEVLKSSDYIGWRSVLIEQRHVGQTFAKFVARETKAPGWHYTGSEREVAQLNFLTLVASAGGDACFATGEGTF